MKRILIVASLALVAFAACKKDESDRVSRVVTVSAPTITVNGSKFMTLSVGQDFVDSGAVLLDDVTGVQSTIFADTPISVDPTTPGMYTLTYSAKNANGYSTTVARYVAVTNYPDNANLSGTYRRQSNNLAVTVTRKARALYMINDFGGAGLSDAGYFAVLDTNAIDFGEQYSETIHSFFTVNVSYLHIRTGDTSFAYALAAPGYGTAVRVFKKQ